jgi:uncharacterized delta-60 repeat protein
LKPSVSVIVRIVLLSSVLFVMGVSAADAATAQGLVTFRVAGGPSSAFGYESGGVSLPDGGVVLATQVSLAALQVGDELVLARLRRDGSLDPTFGDDGIAHVHNPLGDDPVEQLLLQPSGRMVAVVDISAGPSGGSSYGLVGIDADGTLDSGFGTNGAVATSVANTCGSCWPAAIGPDGSIAVTGTIVDAGMGGAPLDAAAKRWVLARYTVDGAPDPRFGANGMASLPGTQAQTYAAAITPDGAACVVGDVSNTGDPTLVGGMEFVRVDNAGNVAARGVVPGELATYEGIVAHANNSVDVLELKSDGPGLSTAHLLVARMNPDGSVAPELGADGTNLGPSIPGFARLYLDAGGGDIVAGPSSAGGDPAEQIVRIAAGGPADVANGGVSTSAVRLPFGGGEGSTIGRTIVRRPLNQSGFGAAPAVVRADGSLVVPGLVEASTEVGEGGYGVGEAAAAGITAQSTLDPTFGGSSRVRLRITVPTQHRKHPQTSVMLQANVPEPGLLRLRVRIAGRVISDWTATITKAGKQDVGAFVPRSVRAEIPKSSRLKVVVAATFKDFAGNEAAAGTGGTLR